MNSKPEAKIIADSISPLGHRLVTMEVKFHRMVLAEMNTHRVFSRNSASSRAIPVRKMIEKVMSDPALPLYWGAAKSGMAASEEVNEETKKEVVTRWLLHRDQAVRTAESLLECGLHKQLVNRILEPWLWHTAIITSTDFANFFAQRLAINPETKQPYAQPEMFYAALAMYKAYRNSTPKLVNYDQWHLPYIQEEDIYPAQRETYRGMGPDSKVSYWLKKISAGRCARVSYLTHDGKRDILEDINLADKLASANPMHPSPFEHVATPLQFPPSHYRDADVQRGNLMGWRQMRHEFPNENITEFNENDLGAFLETA
jgi:thymidylate synthase ThyX